MTLGVAMTPGDEVVHDVWMMLNCGVPDGGCSCHAVRPQGGFRGLTFAEIGQTLGEHLDEVLG